MEIGTVECTTFWPANDLLLILAPALVESKGLTTGYARVPGRGWIPKESEQPI